MKQGQKIQIGIIGECLIELSGQLFGDLKQSCGGDTYNTAVYLRRLLDVDQFDVHYLTGLGDDPLSDEMVSLWQKEHISTQFVQRIANKRPGLYQVTVDEKGERSFFYWRDDAAARYIFNDVSVADIVLTLKNFQWVYLSGISLAILTKQGRKKLLSALAKYSKQGGKIVFDNNYRPILWANIEQCRKAYKAILAITDIALLTEEEEKEIWGQSRIDTYPCSEVVVKRGEFPCILKIKIQDGSVDTFEVLADVVAKVTDTTAAGDSFAAAYWAGRLTGVTPEESAKQAHHLAATVIQYSGAIVPN